MEMMDRIYLILGYIHIAGLNSAALSPPILFIVSDLAVPTGDALTEHKTLFGANRKTYGR